MTITYIDKDSLTGKDMETTKDLGDLLFALREKRNMTRNAVCGYSGVSAECVRRVELGKNITVDKLIGLLECLGCELVIRKIKS